MRASIFTISDSLHVLNFGSRRTVHCDAKRGIAKQKLNTKHVHDQIVLSDDYLDFDREPLSRLIGPVKVQLIPGKGRGVLATRDVVCGEPLLLSQPVIFMKDELGFPPRLETAIKAMRSEDLSAGKKYVGRSWMNEAEQQLINLTLTLSKMMLSIILIVTNMKLWQLLHPLNLVTRATLVNLVL
ncbi:hypothetical protein CEUSTIGMA_g8166.t1 [Chlamydomonas eustigma]|uniref:Uncharacterized protein n=1 Tax=Chlamydomonas eustigma TaxID=1157962 RepID=A0A250XCD3_9CHLO|nr:hypothetical protein CEUSTIGMA_g8166.t1 [Chlamydomonas eustigma]|eukprot:GAX80731.1 hypothetical protein CEUSTIGMA_g8166.t1 [Chlamydomonas eustigma]